jgi:hypothetical protein
MEIERLRQAQPERADNDCPLVHCHCGACGHEIRKDQTCGCEDKRHPIGKFQQTKVGRLADELNRLRPVVYELKEQRVRLEQLYEERLSQTEYRLAKALLDALDALAVAERDGE